MFDARELWSTEQMHSYKQNKMMEEKKEMQRKEKSMVANIL